ncbi:hypothetical protein BH11MYX1_BH11MYX1_23890 [soil metagenome]
MFALQRAFAHLELDVDDNYIGAEGGPEDRYASAYE